MKNGEWRKKLDLKNKSKKTLTMHLRKKSHQHYTYIPGADSSENYPQYLDGMEWNLRMP